MSFMKTRMYLGPAMFLARNLLFITDSYEIIFIFLFFATRIKIPLYLFRSPYLSCMVIPASKSLLQLLSFLFSSPSNPTAHSHTTATFHSGECLTSGQSKVICRCSHSWGSYSTLSVTHLAQLLIQYQRQFEIPLAARCCHTAQQGGTCKSLLIPPALDYSNWHVTF